MFLGLAQNMAHAAATTTPKSLILRARVSFLSFAHRHSHCITWRFPETRKTYRAVFSEPKLVIPSTSVGLAGASDAVETKQAEGRLPETKPDSVTFPVPAVTAEAPRQPDGQQPKKRGRDSAERADNNTIGSVRKKRKGKKLG